MGFKPSKSQPDFGTLRTSLANSGIAVKQNALYQTIFGLISRTQDSRDILIENINDTNIKIGDIETIINNNLLGNFTEGSIPFGDVSGNLTEDNSNLFFNNVNKRVGIGANSGLSGKLHIQGAPGDTHTLFIKTGAAGNNIISGRNSAGTSIFQVLDNSGNGFVRISTSAGLSKIELHASGESFFRGGIVSIDTTGSGVATFTVGDINAAPAGAYTAIAGSKIASGGAASAISLRTNLAAAANGDILTQINVDSLTYAKGAFTGLKAAALRFAGSNIAASGAGTIDTAASVWIVNAPTIGTRNYSLRIEDGIVALDTDGEYIIGATLTTGLTGIAPTDVGYFIRLNDPGDGGVAMDGMSNSGGSTVPWLQRGIFGNTDPADANPAMAFRGGKRSGTGGANLGDDETGFQFQKFDGTALITILGNGRLGILTATPSDFIHVAGASIRADDFKTVLAAFMMRTVTAWNNGAAAAVGTLNNAPTAGDPTKWIPVDDNGITRHMPAW